ncbi:Bromodomain-containing protein 7 [Sesamum alatum]|uniref:Bromodomain-containing protein 7 n=1 Tax=Sesamum alatum TaxID=300844 RepID=A0AAE1Y011_9LAMI|nr:Bromodomain-containing protein 7 [Sesamum alatum]
MGQIVKRKKKGRPAKADPGARELLPEPERDLRRSLRRRNVKYVFDLDDYFDEDELFADDEDRRRREKKLNLLLKLGETQSTEPQPSRARRVEHAPLTSASSSDDDDKPSKKRKIDEDMDEEDMDDENDDANDQDNYNDEDDEEVRERKSEPKAEDSPPGTPAETPSVLPLPDKRTLELILDKLQKKDIYGVYAEPVDPEELPDYHDVIEHPMDFATVRNKLGNGSYATFEQFESDVFLICSNAMQYNAPDTIYYKQARSIQELAKKKFHKVRLNAGRLEKEIKPEQKLRSGSLLKKQIKRHVRTVQEPVCSDFSSGATLATVGDIQNVTNTLQTVASEKAGSIDGLVEGNSFMNDNNLDKAEESLPGKGLLSRYGKKSFIHDENRRATYSISLSHPVASSESIFSTFEGETKQLVPVGLYSDHSYARSLARFAATLGSVAWKVASKRIEQALPQGFKFGRGNLHFFAKVQPPADPRKFEKIPMVSVSSKESSGSVPFLEQKLPFLGPTGMRPPSASTITAQQVRGNSSDMTASFFLSPAIKPSGTPNLSYQHQNLQSRASAESDKKVLKQVELNGPPSLNKNAGEFVGNRQISKSTQIEASRCMEFSSKNANFLPPGSFKQPDSNGVALGGLPDGKVIGNRVDSNTIAGSASDKAKPASCYPHEQGQGQGQGQGLSDPVQLMRMLAEKAHNQQKPLNQSSADAAQALPSAPSLSSNDSNNAAVAAARAWMSVGAGGFRPVSENAYVNKNQIYADSLYNSTRDIQSQVSRFRGEFPASGVHVQPDKNGSPRHAFVPQGPIPMIVGSEMQFQNQRMVFPQFTTTDLSRFQLQSTWQNISPQIHSRPKQESLPPDLNIGFQSSGSPGRPSSGVLVDSQQPDLALQL